MFDDIVNALNYVSSSLDKAGPRPLRGILGGKPRELLSAVPFSDTMGLTDPKDIVSGRNLTDNWGVTDKHDQGWGAWGAGMATEALLDPKLMLGGASLGLKALSRRTAPGDHLVHHLAGLLGDPAATARVGQHLNPMEAAQFRKAGTKGALGLPFDDLHVPPQGMARSDPEWINNKTFYHGSGDSVLNSVDINPLVMKANNNEFGRGIYQTSSDAVGRAYMRKPSPALYQSQSDFRRILDLEESLTARQYRDLYDQIRSGVVGQNPIPNSSGPLFLGEDFDRLAKVNAWQAYPTGARQAPDNLIQLASRYSDYKPERDPIITALKSRGYDAMTHRAGWGSYPLRGIDPAHGGDQVLIGLDPNDVLGLGRKTPYQRWEAM